MELGGDADNGRRALEILEEVRGEVDLLLTDVIMPEMSGHEVAEAVRRRWPNTAVVYMSGYTDDATMRDDLSHAGETFLQKPFTTGALTTKVGEALRRARERRAKTSS